MRTIANTPENWITLLEQCHKQQTYQEDHEYIFKQWFTGRIVRSKNRPHFWYCKASFKDIVLNINKAKSPISQKTASLLRKIVELRETYLFGPLKFRKETTVLPKRYKDSIKTLKLAETIITKSLPEPKDPVSKELIKYTLSPSDPFYLRKFSHYENELKIELEAHLRNNSEIAEIRETLTKYAKIIPLSESEIISSFIVEAIRNEKTEIINLCMEFLPCKPLFVLNAIDLTSNDILIKFLINLIPNKSEIFETKLNEYRKVTYPIQEIYISKSIWEIVVDADYINIFEYLISIPEGESAFNKIPHNWEKSFWLVLSENIRYAIPAFILEKQKGKLDIDFLIKISDGKIFHEFISKIINSCGDVEWREEIFFDLIKNGVPYAYEYKNQTILEFFTEQRAAYIAKSNRSIEIINKLDEFEVKLKNYLENYQQKVREHITVHMSVAPLVSIILGYNQESTVNTNLKE